MNKITHLLLTTLASTVFLMPSITKTSSLPWYHRAFRTYTQSPYTVNCAFINVTRKLRQTALYAYYRLTHKKDDLDQALSTVQTQLKKFEKGLFILEQEALITIKQKYSISDEIWEKCLQDIERVKNSYKNGMLNAYPDITHDETIPTNVLETIIMLLKLNNINPQSISIKMISDETKIAAHAETIAQAVISISVSKDNANNSFIIDSEYIPSAIELSPRVNDAPLSQQISFCAHEVQHLVNLDPITTVILIEYLKYYYAVDKNEFEKSAEYHQLSQIHEAQAEVLSAINNPVIATHMKEMREKKYYPDHLYEEHFYQISTIDMLWKIHDKLEAAYFC